MGIVLVGLSHKTAPIDIRERLTVPTSRLKKVLSDLKSLNGVKETVVLSTCNRLEIYARPEKVRRETIDSLYHYVQNLYEHPQLKTSLYQRESAEAVQHLFRVASGLDSLVVGETEVLGQVKSAYQFAQKFGTTGKNNQCAVPTSSFCGKTGSESDRYFRGSQFCWVPCCSIG